MRKNNQSEQVGDPTSDRVASGRATDDPRERVVSLFEEHNAALVRFLAARLHSDEEAREIAQEAYVRLLGLNEPDAVNHFRAYLFRVAANLANDRLKQRKRRASLRKTAFVGAEESSPSPEKAVLAAQELAIVREALAELPPRCRTAFLLYKVHQLSIAETASRMELSVRMVRLYVARALAHCAERLESAAPDPNLAQVFDTHKEP
ncbi:MAG: RNA polymerase sigma factor [Gammaproteobacteria bacterium]|nr:RNA polymerase sigma factor [Gammaproteobacteria bacterium]MYH34424.1 RNA polymerase sigma factor [Gammaproteobacteria bacterium]MYL01831.1 RNA polymerase sigma factor [Gammaproteobacteria bacterium]